MSRGRGRGRGRGKPFGHISEALGLSLPGEPPLPPILTPPPLYPLLERKPLKLLETPAELLAIKQDLRQFMKQSPFYLKASSAKVEIERYSDKYKQFKGTEIDDFLEWHPDWKFFPAELQIGVKRRKRRANPTNFVPSIPVPKRQRISKQEGKESYEMSNSNIASSESMTGQNVQRKVTFANEPQVTKRLEPLSKLDEVQDKKEEEEGEEGDEGEAEEEYYDEEIEEEDTDYNLTYFDNGEDYGGDEEETLEEGPYY